MSESPWLLWKANVNSKRARLWPSLTVLDEEHGKPRARPGRDRSIARTIACVAPHSLCHLLECLPPLAAPGLEKKLLVVDSPEDSCYSCGGTVSTGATFHIR